jgi:hypothetical protein
VSLYHISISNAPDNAIIEGASGFSKGNGHRRMKRPKQLSDRINRIDKIFSLFPEETTKYSSPAAKSKMFLPRSGLFFPLSSGKRKIKKYPENPVNPV